MTTLPNPEVDAAQAERSRRAVTWRSLLIGTVGVAAICAATPYNDYVINNSFLTGNFFPPGLVLALLLLIGGNGLVSRLMARHALSRGEMGLITAMLLVGCSVPGQGLMRMLVPLPVAVFHLGATDKPYRDAFAALGLPGWLFPVPDMASGASSDVVVDFYGRTPDGGAIPWGAWVVPLMAWGAFVACLYAALLSLAALLRQQWAVNERLPFPLAQLGVMLIEPPTPGRAFNRLLGGRLFWLSAVSVFVLQGLVALHVYQPRYFPDLSFTFDLSKQLTEEPWRHLDGSVKRATLYFTFVGITYFIQSRVAFSLWAILVVEQLIAMLARNGGSDISGQAWEDQHLGACAVFLAGTLWVGRRHWATVARQVVGLGGQAPGEPSYAGRGRAFVVATLGMVTWLVLVGVSPWFAVVIVGFILAVHVIIARIVAETGLPFMRIVASLPQVTSNAAPSLLSGRDMFFNGVSNYFGPVGSRESLLPHALHGAQVAQGDDESPARRRGVMAAMVWALAVAFVVSAVASLWCYYTYTLPLNRGATQLVNHWGVSQGPQLYVTKPLVSHAEGRYPPQAHDRALHMGAGAAITGVLQVGALRYAGWPLMPVAYLVSHTWYMRLAWWSILLGWAAKVLILRFGGASLFQQLKPVFVGLIVGEAMATGFWLLVAVALVWTGNDYEVVQFLPQ